MRFIFRFFTSDKKISKKIAELDQKISNLEASMNQVKENLTMSDKEKSDSPPTIHINHLQVDSIVIEQLDYANNFGQLGIKDLSGKLNIGTSYEGDLSELIKKKVNEKLGNQAKVNFRAKKEG